MNSIGKSVLDRLN